MAKTTQEKLAYARKVQTWTEELFRELIPGVPLVKVLTKPDTDWDDGDDIVYVSVVVNDTTALDGGRMNELRSRVWDRRDYENGDAYPVFRFMNVPDAKELGLVS